MASPVLVLGLITRMALLHGVVDTNTKSSDGTANDGFCIYFSAPVLRPRL